MHRLSHIPFVLAVLPLVAPKQTANEIQQLIIQNEGNLTALSELSAAPWVNSPTVRGTADILLTCLVTLVACVYSVLHLNIPANKGKYSIFLSKLRWVFGALIVPDVLLSIAIGEFVEAMILRAELKKMREGNPRMPEYDLEFCFYVVMGGFQVSTQDILPKSSQRTPAGLVPLSPRGFLKMMEFKHLEEIPLLDNPESLGDMNKANIFQKVLIVAQVLWMALQCLARVILGLPIALVEVHVMFHVICTVIIYVFWLWKPMDIAHAEVLAPKSEEMQGFIALAAQTHFFRWSKELDFILHDDLWHSDEPLLPPPPIFSDHEFYSKLSESVNSRAMELAEESADVETPLPRARRLTTYGDFDGIDINEGNHGRSRLQLSPEDILRIRRAVSFLRRISGGSLDRSRPLVHPEEYTGCFNRPGKNLPTRVTLMGSRISKLWQLMSGLWYSLPDKFSSPGSNLAWKVRYAAGGLLSLLYGAIHLTARGYKFPTPTEKMMWEASAITICVAAAVSQISTVAMRWGLDSKEKPLDKLIDLLAMWTDTVGARLRASIAKEEPGELHERLFDSKILREWWFWQAWLYWGALFVVLPLLGLAGVMNLAARIFITVESFLSIRSMPIGSFTMPEWLQMIPHL